MKNIINKPSIFILIIMVSLGPFGDTLYAPALIEIQKYYNTSYDIVQLTITSYLFGYSTSQLLYGALSDRYGRKKIMLFGTSLFLISSIICIISTNINSLIIARLLQGFGASAGGVIATVAVKDCFEQKQQGSIFAIMNIAFALAPGIGAILGIFLSLKYIFIVLLVAAILFFIKVLFFFPETNLSLNYDALKPKTFIKNYLILFKDHQFIISTVILGLNIGMIYGCLIELPDIFISILKLNKNNFLYLLLLMIFCVTLGSLLCSKISKKIKHKIIINIGMVISLIGGICLFFIVKYIPFNQIHIILAIVLSLTFIGVSFTVPLLTAIALQNFDKNAGTASSTMGFIQMGMASMITAIMTLLPFDSLNDLTTAFITIPVIGLIIFFPYSCYFIKK